MEFIPAFSLPSFHSLKMMESLGATEIAPKKKTPRQRALKTRMFNLSGGWNEYGYDCGVSNGMEVWMKE